MLLITGSKGQLGTCISALLPDAICTDFQELDIANSDAVNEFVRANKIDTIVNCAAYTNVDKAEDDFSNAEKINVLGVKNLAQSGARVVHISTDYVFDGTNHLPYTEADKPNPLSVYGKTKFAGECELFKYAKSAVVIRTAWLYSQFGNNFVKTIRRLGGEKTSLNVIFDQIGTPTYAPDLAEAIVKILPQLSDGQKQIYNFTNEGVCSWFDFASAIMRLSNLPCTVRAIETKDYPQKAKRPPFSVLNKAKIKREINIEIPHWQESLEKCISLF